MTDQPEPTKPTEPGANPPAPPAPRRRHPLRRIGCTIVLVLWFLLLLTPCLLFYMASQGEISVRLGNLPDQSLRIWLVTEPQQRGIGVSSPAVARAADGNTACLQMTVHYWLWYGEAEEAVQYCECFSRADRDADWTMTEMESGTCAASDLMP